MRLLDILIIIELVLFIYINFRAFKIVIRLKSLKSKFYKTIKQIDKFGYLIGIYGAVGTGKTSYSSGLSHGFQIIICEKIESTLKNTKTIFNKLDFNEIDLFIINELENYEDRHVDFNNLAGKVLKEFNLYNYPIFHYVGHRTIKGVIKDYLIALDAKIRNNFVMSKTKFYSYITGNYNYEYNLKDREILTNNINYSIFDYLVEIQDEASDDNGKHKWQEKIDLGAKEYKSKIRHIHKETNRLIIIRQDATDEVKAERDLLQTNITMQEQKKINPYGWLLSDLKRYFKLRKFIKIFLKIKLPFYKQNIKRILKRSRPISFNEYIELNYNYPNIIRNINKDIMWCEKFFLFNSYLEYKIDVRKKADDANRILVASDFYKHYFPVYMSYAYNRFEYSNVQEDLLKESKYKAKKVNAFKDATIKQKENISDTKDLLDLIEIKK